MTLRIAAMVVVAIAAAACGRPQPAPIHHAAPAASAEVKRVIELNRTACLGGCASYHVAIKTNGDVEYTGRSWVKHTGKAAWSIPSARVDELVAAFEQEGFEAFPADLVDGALDVAGTQLRFRDRVIDYNTGPVLIGSPEEARRNAVERLANAVDRAVDIDRWIGTEAERDAMFEAARLEHARTICEKRAPADRRDCYEDQAVTPPP